MTTTTTVSGYQLREAIRRWELRKDSSFERFGESLIYFPDDPKPDPVGLADSFSQAEDAIVALQVAQMRYNLLVKVSVLGVEMPLGQAVKRIGGAGRLGKMWRDATGNKKDRYSTYREDTRKSDEIRANRTMPVNECMSRADKAAVFAGAMRAAIATGNSVQLPIAEIGLDPKLLEE